MFTWVVALVLCPAHCVVHLLLLCGVVVGVSPTILGCFIDPDVFREVPADVSAGAVGAPCWLVATYVPVYAGITAALAALFYLWCYYGAAVGSVVADAATVALRSFPVAVAFGSLPSLVAGFGSAGC